MGRSSVRDWGVFLLRWILIGSLVGLLSGSASALFLTTLGWATATRERLPWLIFGLPLLGLGIGGFYHHFGKSVEGGTNLVLDQIHEPNEPVPVHLAPVILIATVLTHLFGGSAGREGTALQMGGALSELLTRPFKLSHDERRILLMAGIAGGFGSVFGTPFAGAVFGVEVRAAGRPRLHALIPCLIASVVGDLVCRSWGIRHHIYPKLATDVSPGLLGWIALSGVAFGLASLLFVELTHWIGSVGKKHSHGHLIRPFFGGIVVVGLTLWVGSQQYNGLGLGLIEDSFVVAVPLSAFALKLLFTSVTLGTGFKGGEVTPLFCIGATLGNAFATVTHQNPLIFAAVGFVSVFGGAAMTPIACAILGMELFGSGMAIPVGIGCLIAFWASGHKGIYGIANPTRVDDPNALIEA